MTREATRMQGGFTLVELLVVIAIIAVLGTIGLTMLMGARRDAEDLEAEAFIKSVSASIEQYRQQRDIGVYPPTSLENLPAAGKLANRTNMGIEALCVALNSTKFKSEHLYDMYDQYIVNEDSDSTSKPLTAVASTELFEMADPWGNPYVYFNAIDYKEATVRQYRAVPEEGGDFEIVSVKPWSNPKTKAFYNKSSFQLFSAGPDLRFNTEDDIGNWSSR